MFEKTQSALEGNRTHVAKALLLQSSITPCDDERLSTDYRNQTDDPGFEDRCDITPLSRYKRGHYKGRLIREKKI